MICDKFTYTTYINRNILGEEKLQSYLGDIWTKW